MTDLVISLFGLFQVQLNGAPVTGFESAKVRALLAYLAAEAGRPQARSVLAGLLWPDWPEAAASKNLRHTLYSLRKTLRDDLAEVPRFHADRQFITFQPGDDCLVDVLVLEEALEAAHGPQHADSGRSAVVDRLSSAVALYRGPFLDSFTLNDSPAFEAWILARREHHNQQILQALCFLSEWYEREGDLDQAEKYTRQQLKLEPWLESAHQQLMRILVSKGERSQALADFEALRQSLKNELDVEPSAGTLDLVQRIRRGEPIALSGAVLPAKGPAVSDSSPDNLPVQLTSFIGREKEIDLVSSLISQHRLVTITGSGGVGKTRLSLRVAEQMQAHFPEGVWFVELAPLRDPGLLAQTVAGVFGLKVNSNRPIAQILFEYLGTRQVLLVLDNCEHLVEECAFLVDDLLRSCRKLKILTSSREALGVAGEILFLTPTMSLPAESQVPALVELEQYEALHLLIERAQTAFTPFQVTASDAPALVQICQRLDGIPLAIELAAARLNVLTPQQLASRLDDAFHLLSRGPRTALPRQQTLRATVDWSYQLLTEQEKGLFRRLSVFASTFDLEAVEAVCGRGEGEEHDILTLLASLVKKSLLIAEASLDLGMRYHLLETVRQFAREELISTGEMASLRDLHAAYYLDLVINSENRLHSMEASVLFRHLDADFSNLRAALVWSLVGELWNKGIAAIIVISEAGYWWGRGILEEGLGWLEKAIKRVDKFQPATAYAQLLGHKGVILGSLGRRAEALDHIETCLAVCQQTGDRLGYARGLHRLVSFAREKYGESRSWEMSLAHFQESAAIYKELGAERDLAFLYHGWGSNEANSGGDLEHALSLFAESEALYRKLGDWYIIFVWFNQGWVYQRLGQVQRARELFLRALPILRELGDQWGLMFVLIFMGSFEMTEAVDDSSLRAAEKLLLEGEDLARKFGSKHYDLVIVLIRLVQTAQRLGDYSCSIERLQEALTILQGLEPVFRDENKDCVLFCLVGLAKAAVQMKNFASAARLLGMLSDKSTLISAASIELSREELAGLAQQARSQLSEDDFNSAWAAGQSMTLDEASQFALLTISEKAAKVQ